MSKELDGIVPCSWCGHDVDEHNNFVHVDTYKVECFSHPSGRVFIDPLEYQFPWRHCVIERQTMGEKDYFDLTKRNKFEEFTTEIIGSLKETEDLVRSCFHSLVDELFNSHGSKPFGAFYYRNTDDPGRVERYRIVRLKQGLMEGIFRGL